MSGSESMRKSTYAILAYFESVDMISYCKPDFHILLKSLLGAHDSRIVHICEIDIMFTGFYGIIIFELGFGPMYSDKDYRMHRIKYRAGNNSATCDFSFILDF